MRILILGGSVFLGRAIAEAALTAQHDVMVLNRGISRTNVPGVKTITGDRNKVEILVEARSEGPWDLVVDTSGFEPETVTLSADMLSKVCAHYVFVSTVSAFARWPSLPVNEESPLLPFMEEKRTYGSSKAECERVLAARLGDSLTVLYPGVIIGPHENIGRLPWWLARHARGGEIVYPELDVPISPIDARDVADFVLTLEERSLAGGRYIVSEEEEGSVTLGDLLGLCASETGVAVCPIYFKDQMLLAQDVEPWSDLPFWAPKGVGADAIWKTDCSAAHAAGLRNRPLKVTVSDTWSWMLSVGARTDISFLPVFEENLGLAEDTEKRILSQPRNSSDYRDASNM